MRFRADGDVAAGPPQVLMEGLGSQNRYHNGGALVFGADGMLYVTVGESHEPSFAQDPNSIGGKVLRLAPDGSVPPDNPIAGNPLFTLGHRNSFGICLDPATGDLWETENGPTSDDEINLLRAGGNYGWPDVMGSGGPAGTIDPVVDHVQEIAPTGCAVWRGALYYGSYLDGAIRRLDLPPGTDPRPVAVSDARGAGVRRRRRPRRSAVRLLPERHLAPGCSADRDRLGTAVGSCASLVPVVGMARARRGGGTRRRVVPATPGGASD